MKLLRAKAVGGALILLVLGWIIALIWRPELANGILMVVGPLVAGMANKAEFREERSPNDHDDRKR